MIIVIIVSRRVWLWHCRSLDSVMNRRRASPSLFVPLFSRGATDATDAAAADRDLKS